MRGENGELGKGGVREKSVGGRRKWKDGEEMK